MLEPIQFNRNYEKKISDIFNIKKIIYDECKTKVKVKKYQPPILEVIVNNSPAASELKLKSQILICKLEIYKIEIVKVITK